MSAHPTSDRVVDTVAVVGLATLVLTALDTTFADRDYLVCGLAGVLAVVGIALLLDQYDKGTGLYLICVIPAYVLVGASIGLRSTRDYFVLPTPEPMRELLAATVSAPNQLLTTVPPVDVVGDASLVPYVLGFAGAGAAIWPALRTRRPVLPLVPLVVVLVLATLIGTDEPSGLALRSPLLAGVAAWWVGQRSARQRPVGRSRRGAPVRQAVAALVVVALAAGGTLLVTGDDGADRVVLRGRVGAGYDVAQQRSPLDAFRRYTKQPAETAVDNVYRQRLLRVRGLPRGVPLRFVALDLYEGGAWRAGNRTVDDVSDDLFLRIGSELEADAGGREVEATVQVKGAYGLGWLPIPGPLTSVSFDFRDGRAQRDDVRYNPATTTAVVVGGLGDGDDYTMTAVVAPSRLARRARAFPTGGPLQPSGAFLDEALRPWAESGLAPLAQVRSLAKYLRTNGRYSDGADRGERQYGAGHDPERLLSGFFTAPRMVGDDEQYAAFLALAANRLGVPARVVVGGTPGPRGWIKGRDVQAWVELRVADGSWRTLPTADFLATKPPRRREPPRQLPEDFVADATRQPRDRDRPDAGDDTPLQPPTSADQEDQPGAGEGGPARSVPAWLVLVGLVGWLVPAAKLVRRAWRRRRGRTDLRILGAWDELLDAAADLGSAVPPGTTRPEQARLLGADVATARAVDTALFAPADPSPSEADEVWRAVDAEVRALRGRAGLRRRVLGWFDPRTLLPRRRRPGRRGRGPGAERPADDAALVDA